MTTYSIYSCSQAAEAAETGLTAAQVIQYIYCDDGQDYQIEAKMEKVCDEEAGDYTGEEAQADGNYGLLVWSVNFKSARGQWRYGVFTIWGETQEKAEHDWLNDCFKNSAFETSKWCIQTDEQYQAELVEIQNQQESDAA